MLDLTPNPVLSWLLRSTWEASILIVLVGLLQWVFRQQLGPRWRHALWLLVVARLLLPVSLPSPFSLYNFTRIKAVPTAGSPDSQQVSSGPSIDANNSPLAEGVLKHPNPASAAAPSPARRPGQGSRAVPFPLLMIWLLGAVLMAARILAQDLRFAARVGRTRMVTDPAVLRILEECRRELKIRFPLSLLATGEVETPALYGAVHPRLLMPEGLLENFSARELRHVFLHELAHVKRQDLATHWLMTLAQVVHWFNPLVWLALGRMQVERELACDTLALSNEPSREAESYGRTLIKLLERLVQPRLNPGLVGFIERKGPIKERIEMIASFKEGKASRWQTLATVPLFLLCLVMLTDAKTPKAELPAPAGMWPADGNGRDVAGGHDGILKGGVTFSPGARGQAFDLNGQDQYVEIANDPALNPAGSFSISAWINPRQDRDQGIVDKWVDSPMTANERSFSFHATPELGLRFGISDLKNQWNVHFHKDLSKPQVLRLNSWNHVVAVYDQPAGTRRIYVDGTMVAERVDPPISIFQSQAAIGIGGRRPTLSEGGSIENFDGLISEVGFYTQALTPAEVKFLYEQSGTRKQ